MHDKKFLFALIILLASVYFYKKKSVDSLILIAVLAVYVFLTNKDTNTNEHFDTEAIQNLSSMFQNGTLTATNLNLTGNLSVGGTANVKGSTTLQGGANITNGGLTVAGTTTINGLANGAPALNVNNGDLNINNSSLRSTGAGNIYIPAGQSLVFGDTTGSTQGISIAIDKGSQQNLLVYNNDTQKTIGLMVNAKARALYANAYNTGGGWSTTTYNGTAQVGAI
jgi:hypothetical protein